VIAAASALGPPSRCARFGPGDMVSPPWHVAYKVRGAGAGSAYSHRGKGLDDASLLIGKVGVEAQFSPAIQVQPGRVKRGRHAYVSPLCCPVSQEFQPSVAQIFVADASNLYAGDRHQVVRAVNRPQGGDDFHRFLHAAAEIAGQHGLFFVSQSHWYRTFSNAARSTPQGMVASRPILAVRAFFPGSWWPDGSRLLPG
jgi:hypothetical protein